MHMGFGFGELKKQDWSFLSLGFEFLTLRSDFELFQTSKEEDDTYIGPLDEMTSFWKNLQKNAHFAPCSAALTAEHKGAEMHLTDFAAPKRKIQGRRKEDREYEFWSLFCGLISAALAAEQGAKCAWWSILKSNHAMQY